MDTSGDSLLLLWTILLVILLVLSSFFSGTETAITAVNKYKIRNLSEKKNRRATILQKLLDKPGKVITTLLIGNNLVNIAASTLATTVAIMYFEDIIHNIAVITTGVTAVMTVFVLIFGEIIPKNIAISRAERFSLAVAPVLSLLTTVMSPVSNALSSLSRVVIKRFSGSMPEKGSLLTEEEIQIMLKASEEYGIIDEEEKEMIEGIFGLGNSIVREIMTPRTDLACIDVTSTVEGVIEIVSKTGHSRIPVYEERIDNVIGIIYAKDLLTVVAEDRSKGIAGFVREAYYVPETKKVDELLKQMRITKNHIAIVVDEYGGTSGVVSFEDILEEIVGDIMDEYDIEETALVKLGDNVHLVSAQINLHELNELLDIDLPTEEDYDTLGGFLFSIFDKIPRKDEIINWRNLEFKVVEVKKNRIVRVQITILKPHKEEEEQDHEEA